MGQMTAQVAAVHCGLVNAVGEVSDGPHKIYGSCVTCLNMQYKQVSEVVLFFFSDGAKC